MIVLTYTTLGRRGFEVYPHQVYSSNRVEDILQEICVRWEVPYQLRFSDFWLVCTITTLNCWSNGRLTFSS